MKTETQISLPGLEDVRAACASVLDPEFGVSIDDLGLIYDVRLEGSAATITMTLTTPSCPASSVIVEGVRAAVGAVNGVTAVDVRLVWDPQWTTDMVNARGRELLGWRPE